MVKLNIQECKWFIILLGFTYYIYNLLLTGKIYYFIHPKMVKYIQFSFVFFCVLTATQLFNIFKIDNHHKKRKISFGVFLLPLILGLCFNPQQLNNQVASRKGITVSTNQTNKPKTASTQNSKAISEDSDLIVNANNFIQVTDDIISSDPQKYKGKLIKITGFVYRDETISKDEFVTGRLIMTCCAADTEITGLLCQWDNAFTLKSDGWITVTGTIDSKLHNFEGKDQIIPFIKVLTVRPTEKPVNQYVYPES